ncbi:MAG: VOC family protein [Dehalococcoidia bacterium]
MPEEKPTMQMHVYVEDVDAVYNKALAAGATSVEEPNDTPYGDRMGTVKDSDGNTWFIATHIRDVDHA